MPSPIGGQRSLLSAPSRFALGVIAALLVAALGALPTLRPGPEDMSTLLLFLSVTAVASVAVGYLSYRLGWWRWPRTVCLTPMTGYLMAIGLVFLNVFVTTQLMFASDHDLMLASILLLFAGGIALSFGYFLSASITESIRRLVTGAESIADGDLSARVVVSGDDELAELATTFNRMAAQLQEAEVRQKELEALRRDLISRVLTNLISNAVRHTPAGGTITVEAWHEVDSERVRVDVSDTGEGIPPADLPHIFEPFYRGEKSRSRATGGAGLG
jgi:signal transduction histidine kinase